MGGALLAGGAKFTGLTTFLDRVGSTIHARETMTLPIIGDGGGIHPLLLLAFLIFIVISLIYAA